MLEICPSIAAAKPALEVHALGIGGKADPVRLVFTAPSGPAVIATMVDMGDPFRMIVNEVDVIQPERSLPKLPVARALWVPKPNLKVAAAAWIYAGGAHHTGFSQALATEHFESFAEIAGIELIVIDAETRLRQLRTFCCADREILTPKASQRFAPKPVFMDNRPPCKRSRAQWPRQNIRDIQSLT
jgi:L-arabinose isomerase